MLCWHLKQPPEGRRLGSAGHEQHPCVEQQIQKAKQGEGDKKQQEQQKSFAKTFLRSWEVFRSSQAFF